MDRSQNHFVRHIVIRLVLGCLFVGALAGCGGGTTNTEPTPTISKSLVNRIDSLMRTEATDGAFSGSMLIAQNGQMLLRKGYGMADYEQQVANKVTTKYQIADLTMQFTALGTLLLQEQGKLHVQDPACTYLSSCPAAWQSITIQQILTMTSGIVDYDQFYTDRDKPETPQQLVARLQSHPLEDPQDRRRNFNSSNYLVLGAIIEKVSGETYANYIQHAILDPLGLQNTGYDLNQPLVPEYAFGYEQAHVKAPFVDPSVLYAQRGMYSTVDDLYKWDQALLKHKIGSKATVDALFTAQEHLCGGKQTCRTYSQLDLGYGWLMGNASNANNHRVEYFTGDGFGFSSGSYYYPDDKLTVIILSNVSNGEYTITSTLQSMLFNS